MRPPPRGVAVDVRPAALHLARARRPAGSARARCARRGAAGEITAPGPSQESRAARVDLPVDEVAGVAPDAGADAEPGARSRARRRRPARPTASPRSRTARRARRCRGTRRARRPATRRRCCTSPPGGRARAARRRARARRARPAPASRSARSLGSAQNAMRFASGDQEKLSTDQSPFVRRRGTRARPRVLDEQVRMPVEVAVSVETPVDAPDHARERRACRAPAGRRRSAARERLRRARAAGPAARARMR